MSRACCNDSDMDSGRRVVSIAAWERSPNASIGLLDKSAAGSPSTSFPLKIIGYPRYEAEIVPSALLVATNPPVETDNRQNVCP